MPILRTLAAGLIGRRTAKRLGRAIPNPILRFAIVTAVTTLVPLAIDRLSRRRSRRGGLRRR